MSLFCSVAFIVFYFIVYLRGEWTHIYRVGQKRTIFKVYNSCIWW